MVLASYRVGVLWSIWHFPFIFWLNRLLAFGLFHAWTNVATFYIANRSPQFMLSSVVIAVLSWLVANHVDKKCLSEASAQSPGVTACLWLVGSVAYIAGMTRAAGHLNLAKAGNLPPGTAEPDERAHRDRESSSKNVLVDCTDPPCAPRCDLGKY